MRVYPTPPRLVTANSVFSHAFAQGQAVFGFRDSRVCTAAMLWSVLVWAASRTASLAHAVERLYPDIQDQTVWNRLRDQLPKRHDALERRLHSLLQLPGLLGRLARRKLVLAVDYHAIPYYGAPKKVPANCDAAGPNAAPPASTPTPPSVPSSPAGVSPSP
jgi:hypothetical protein